jgi:hypothetical protein
MTTAAGLRYTAMTIPWHPMVIATVVGAAVVASGQARLVMIPSTLLAAAAGFAFDDSSHETLAASPSSLIRRRLGRLIVVIPPTIILWATLVSQGVNGRQETLTLVAMFAGLVGLTLGIAGVAAHRTDGRGGAVAAPVLLLALVVSAIVPPRWRPLPLGDVPGRWPALQTRWSTAAVIGTLVLLASCRDPARRRLLRYPTDRPGTGRQHV